MGAATGGALGAPCDDNNYRNAGCGGAGSSFGLWCSQNTINVSRDATSVFAAGQAGARGTSLGNQGTLGDARAIGDCANPQN